MSLTLDKKNLLSMGHCFALRKYSVLEGLRHRKIQNVVFHIDKIIENLKVYPYILKQNFKSVLD